MSECKLIIRASQQRAEFYRGAELLKTYVISTAANGLGNEIGSYKTALGVLRVAKKLGAGSEPGTVFRARVATGEVWSVDSHNPLSQSNEDLVLTRILWLEGTEPANASTLHRYIYLHGTNQEHLLGQPVSHGCIRFSNQDIIEVFELLPEGAEVEVVE